MTNNLIVLGGTLLFGVVLAIYRASHQQILRPLAYLGINVALFVGLATVLHLYSQLLNNTHDPLALIITTAGFALTANGVATLLYAWTLPDLNDKMLADVVKNYK